MFLAAYGQDCLDFILAQSTFQRWWSDQRMWLIRALSPFVFGTIEFVMKRLGLPTHEFVVTSKVIDAELSRRYDQGVFEFGVPSPMFVPLATAAILNLIAFLGGFVLVLKERSFCSFFIQMFIAGFGVMNSLPFYEGMVLRRDKGRMPTKTTLTSTLLVGLLYGIASFVLKI
ncbi:Cellulose synthase-like protein G3 [Sesamum angolense]|uniref:Cellulose synthase-like protein G3 n=1 Tax=Sesamum angolense TaxID=2727404 RepID=A0AAE1W9E3_9LAMI|nr:Cellulose synthase-like protein G3 [Sesamum angolense]